MTIQEAFFIGGCICAAITVFFIFLCKKLSINYKTFLLHSLLGFLTCSILEVVAIKLTNLNALMYATPTTTIIFALFFSITGFIISQDIIAFSLLIKGLILWYEGLKIGYLFYKLSITKDATNNIIVDINFLNDPIFKTSFAFFVTISTFLLWAIWHKKYIK